MILFGHSGIIAVVGGVAVVEVVVGGPVGNVHIDEQYMLQS